MPHYASSRIGITSIVASLAFAFASLLVPAGCGSTSTGNSDGPTPADATMIASGDMSTGGGADMAMSAACTGNETFSEAFTAMLMGCSGLPMCHTTAPFGGGLDLTRSKAYKGMVNVMAAAANKTLVKPGDADNSFLYQKLTNTQGKLEGLPMPKGEGIMWMPPDPAQLKILRCWIQNGAKDN